MERDALPSVRLAQLRDLRHPMSVDLWIDRVGAHAKVIVVRLLGGLDWWRYGADRLAALARERGIALALLPGEDRDDPRLARGVDPAASTSSTRCCASSAKADARTCARCCAGSPAMPARALEAAEPQPVPRMAGYLPGIGAVDLDRLAAQLPPGRPVVPIIFYRSMLLAADVAPIDALCDGAGGARPCAGAARDHEPQGSGRGGVPPRGAGAARAGRHRHHHGVCRRRRAGRADAARRAGVPVLQVVIATTKRAAWRDSPRGLGAADLAMHVVLPELDGRVLAGAVAFKDPLPPQDGLAFTGARQPAGAGPDRLRGGSRRRAGAAAARRRAASGASRC